MYIIISYIENAHWYPDDNSKCAAFGAALQTAAHRDEAQAIDTNDGDGKCYDVLSKKSPRFLTGAPKH